MVNSNSVVTNTAGVMATESAVSYETKTDIAKSAISCDSPKKCRIADAFMSEPRKSVLFQLCDQEDIFNEFANVVKSTNDISTLWAEYKKFFLGLGYRYRVMISDLDAFNSLQNRILLLKRERTREIRSLMPKKPRPMPSPLSTPNFVKELEDKVNFLDAKNKELTLSNAALLEQISKFERVNAENAATIESLKEELNNHVERIDSITRDNIRLSAIIADLRDEISIYKGMYVETLYDDEDTEFLKNQLEYVNKLSYQYKLERDAILNWMNETCARNKNLWDANNELQDENYGLQDINTDLREENDELREEIRYIDGINAILKEWISYLANALELELIDRKSVV